MEAPATEKAMHAHASIAAIVSRFFTAAPSTVPSNCTGLPAARDTVMRERPAIQPGAAIFDWLHFRARHRHSDVFPDSTQQPTQ
jgi:hypothetical protein